MKKRNISGLLTTAAALMSGSGVFAQSVQGTFDRTKPAAAASQAATPASKEATPGPQPPAATPAAPASDSANFVATDIVIQAVQGSVRYRENSESNWVVARKAGAMLKEGVEFQLGLRSVIVLRVGASQDLTFDHLGNYIFTDAFNDGKRDFTRIKLPGKGRVQFDVKKTKFENRVEIQTPDMTLAVVGTQGAIEYTPGHPTLAIGAEENRGRIELEFLYSKQRRALTRNERSSTASPDPAMNFARAAIVDTATEAAREKDEVRVLKRTEGGTQLVPLDFQDAGSAGSRITLPITPPVGPSGSPRSQVPRPTGPITILPGGDVATQAFGSRGAALLPGNVGVQGRLGKSAREFTGSIDMVALNARVIMMANNPRSFTSGRIDAGVLRGQMIRVNATEGATPISIGTFNGLPNTLVHPIDAGADIGRTVAEFRAGLAPLQVTLPTPE